MLVFWGGYYFPAGSLPDLTSDVPPPAAAVPKPVSPPAVAAAHGQVAITAKEAGVWVKVTDAVGQQLFQKQLALGETYIVPRPFVVMATQNPIEIEGTYALPEAQVDRFMMKILIGYPSEEEEFVIVQRVTGEGATVGPVTSTEALLEMQAAVRKLYIDPSLMIYAVKVVAATRAPEKCGLPDYQRFIQFGASPRASIAMIEAGRALAYIRGRDYVLPADVMDVAADVLRHRLVPSYEALSEGLTSDQIVNRILRAVSPPILDAARATGA